MRIKAKSNYHQKKEKLKLVTENQKRQKRNKTNADVVVDITWNLELYYKIKNDNAASPNRNKEDLKSTMQKSMMSREELKSVFNLLFS